MQITRTVFRDDHEMLRTTVRRFLERECRHFAKRKVLACLTGYGDADMLNFFDEAVRQHARPTETSAFENLVKTAQRAIDSNSGDFESHLDDLRGRNLMILWRQDWFVIDRFKWLAQDVYLFPDAREHAQLVAVGSEALKANDIDKLRVVVMHLDSIRIGSAGEDDMLAGSNIVRS